MTPPHPRQDSQQNEIKISISPSLPQNDGPIEHEERKLQLEASRKIYNYENVTGLPMPLASDPGVVAQALMLLKDTDWLQGQFKNQVITAIDLKLWGLLSEHQQDRGDLDDYQNRITVALQTMLHDNTNSDDITSGDPLTTIQNLARHLSQESGNDTTTFNNFAAYGKAFTIYSTPAITGLWRDDKIFSSQRLAGLNPMAMQLVTNDGSIGANWEMLRKKLSPDINDDSVRHFLGPDASIAQAIEEKRLFTCDYQALKLATAASDAPGAQKGQPLMAPIALFVLTDDFPAPQIAAIQIDQAMPDKNDTNFACMLAEHANSPGNEFKWVMAKMFVQTADINYNQAVNHLCETHLIEEAFALATHRHLALQHPLYILLSYHFEALMVINKLGQLTLLNTDGLIQKILEGGLSGSLELIQNAYKDWTFDDMDFAQRIIDRGLSPDNLPYFPYRDDGLLIWDLLGDYIKEYLGKYYKKGDSDVRNDYELQAWAAELASQEGAHIKGFKNSIDSIQELVSIVQRLIWTAGPQHAAVNFPQIDYAAFMPNMPAATYINAPANFNNIDINELDILAMLPPANPSATQIKTTYALAGFHMNELLDYYQGLEGHARQICESYYKKLQGTVTTTIISRNQQRSAQHGLLPYSFFLPKNIPNSTNV